MGNLIIVEVAKLKKQIFALIFSDKNASPLSGNGELSFESQN